MNCRISGSAHRFLGIKLQAAAGFLVRLDFQLLWLCLAHWQ
jgi:hypothetical protein